MEKLKNIFENLISFILPRDAHTIKMELMSDEDILSHIEPANETSDTKYKALFYYKNPLARKAIWEIKYRGNKKIVAKFSKFLYEYILEELSSEMAFADFQTPLVIPIPTSTRTIRERGFNQCALIVKELAKYDGGKNFEVHFHVLSKIRETPHQAKLKNKTDRLKNLKGSFKANAGLVKGRNIILIDDVITTGTTMREAAKTLREAGAKKVIGFAIAH